MTISMCRPLFFSSTASGAAGVAAIAGKLRGIAQLDGPAAGADSRSVAPSTAKPVDRRPSWRRRAAPHSSRKFFAQAMTLAPRFGIVALAALGAVGLGDGVGAVERVVERAPARIGGVERIARVHHRHDELRPGDDGDLGIDILGRDAEGRAFRQEIADLLQESLVGVEIGRRAIVAMPVVDLVLQRLALCRAAPGSSARGRGRLPRKTCQNAASSTPVPGSASSAMNCLELARHLQGRQARYDRSSDLLQDGPRGPGISGL